MNTKTEAPCYIIRRTPDVEFHRDIAAKQEGLIITVRESLWPTLTPTQQRRVLFLREPTLTYDELFRDSPRLDDIASYFTR